MVRIIIFRIFVFSLLTKAALASQVVIEFENCKLKQGTVLLSKGESVISSKIIDNQTTKSIYLNSDLIGIHKIVIDSTLIIYLNINRSYDIHLVVNLLNLTYRILDSPSSEMANNLYSNFREVESLLKFIGDPSFKDFDKAFNQLSKLIIASEVPMIIDWATNFLINLETDPNNYHLPFEKFSDFEQEVREKYPLYNFLEMKSNFTVRRDNQSGYYWKY